jgi:L-2-hydroxyglutarate oxidase
MRKADVVIIGGGIIGLATAYRLGQRFPELRVVVLEKEPEVARHQTGHNSGVLHSGIYYRPGSLRAKNCREGKKAMEAFCAEHGIPCDVCGKVIVAVDESELAGLERIFHRGQENQVRCEMIGAARLRELEPHAAGVRAIHVPEAGIVDFARVARRLAELVTAAEGEIVTRARVTHIGHERARVVVASTAGDFEGRLAVNCGGLHSDRIVRMSGETPPARIVPFRGEYYVVKPEARHLCRNLIYPVPDPNFPFLGVHFTRLIEGGLECGPNAVLALSREGYQRGDFSLRDTFDSLAYPGFWRLAVRHWRAGAEELWRSMSKGAFVASLARLVPAIRAEMLDTGPTGVRAQAVSPDGAIVDDFLFHVSGRVVNVCNAPSPAATSSLNIGTLIVDNLAERLE